MTAFLTQRFNAARAYIPSVRPARKRASIYRL